LPDVNNKTRKNSFFRPRTPEITALEKFGASAPVGVRSVLDIHRGANAPRSLRRTHFIFTHPLWVR